MPSGEVVSILAVFSEYCLSNLKFWRHSGRLHSRAESSVPGVGRNVTPCWVLHPWCPDPVDVPP